MPTGRIAPILPNGVRVMEHAKLKPPKMIAVTSHHRSDPQMNDDLASAAPGLFRDGHARALLGEKSLRNVL